MRKKTLICLAASVLTWLAASLTSGAAASAGGTLLVRTLDPISSQDVPGTRFSAQLENNLVADGKTVLRAGTKMSGKVVTSRRIVSSSERLTVDITNATVNGRTVPIRTTGAVQLDNTNFKTKNDRYVGRAAFQVAAGRLIEFRLAQPPKS